MVGDQRNTWFEAHEQRKVVLELLKDAAKQEHGRWQWRGFYLEKHEFDSVSRQVLRAFVADHAWDD